jgi:hypothetical protein
LPKEESLYRVKAAATQQLLDLIMDCADTSARASIEHSLGGSFFANNHLGPTCKSGMHRGACRVAEAGLFVPDGEVVAAATASLAS